MADSNRVVDAESTLNSASVRAAIIEKAGDFADAAQKAAIEALSASVSAGANVQRAEAVLLEVQQARDAIEAIIEDGGLPGKEGAPGESAYQIAVRNGFVGSEAQWLESIKGTPGTEGDDAYEVAVKAGFTGTRAEWLATLKGNPGDPGENGDNGTAATIAVGSVSSGDSPSVRNVGTPNAAILEFVLQRGEPGKPGDPGLNGAAATIELGTVTTSDTTASVSMRGTAQARILDFVLQRGSQGLKGDPGVKGDPGQGVPPGGVAGQILAKSSLNDYETQWINPPTGSGSGGGTSDIAVSVNNTEFSIGTDGYGGIQVVDSQGFVSFRITETGEIQGNFQSTSALPDKFTTLATRNARNMGLAAAVRDQINTLSQPPVFEYNHFFVFGQSLGSGAEGWPALTTVPRYEDNLMFGQSVRPSFISGDRFLPVGDQAVLTPLKAVVQNFADSTKILTPAEQAALTQGDQSEGETVDVSAMGMLRKLFLERQSVARDQSRKFVTSNCAVSGRSVFQLMKGNAANEYMRLVNAATAVKTIADSEGKTYGVTGLLWMQGEYDYSETNGGVNNKDTYKANLLKIITDFNTDVVKGIAGQKQMPAIFTYQTGSRYTTVDDEIRIGMAQWELAQEQQNWFMVGPVYPYTDKGGHMDPNGYRWFGLQVGKVMHRVLVQRQKWKPLSPRDVTLNKQELLIDFHVPHPPLQFDVSYYFTTAQMYADKGFRVYDANGAVPMTEITIASDTIVRILLSRPTVGAVRVVYGSKNSQSNGDGNLRDSDPTQSDEVYTYNANSGQYANANIPELVNKPYPLYNWAIAFNLPARVI